MARKILLADDSVTAQNMGRRILTDAGYDVITVNNGSAALKKATEQKPDLIVLDVYMPGYGGLEVCQRLRETQETARIPVLLTVGKLEPFKPEEAKRVRADAYVIKPFEASELLAALTKLEDRIVPEGAAPKGKNKNFDSSKGEKFGDTETGWKNRLNIPPPARKANVPEEEATENSAKETAKSAEPEKTAAAKAEATSNTQKENKPEAAASSSQKLPADITPEEIAALASAAAVIRQKEGAPASSPTVAASTPDASSTAKEVKIESAANAVSEVAANASSEKNAPSATEKAPEKEEKKDTDASATSSAKAEPASAPEPAESEVAAVLASLTPVESKESAKEVPVGAIAQAAAVGASAFSGPRWIAEEIPLSDQDASSSLEGEMEKSAQGKSTASVATTSSAAVESISAASSQTESAAASVIGSEKAQEAPPAPAPAVANISTEAVSSSAIASSAVPSQEINSTSSTPKEPAALAAAASAQPSAPDAVSTERIKSESAKPAGEERQRESQLAAAWENWQTVRESILGSQLTSQITEAASETLKEAQKEQAAAASTENKTDASSTDKPTNPTAIASIVDTVLAELKPKLMEEIARKLGSEKK